MPSVPVQLARNIAARLNDTNFVWPNPVFGQDDVTSEHLITSYVTAEAKVAPLVKRTEIGLLKLFVAPPSDTRQESSNGRCGRKSQYSLNVLVVQRLDEEDADEIQPGHFKEIEQLMAFNEAVYEFFDQNRSILAGTDNATLERITQTAFDEPMLKNSNVYMGNTAVVYRVN